VNSFLRVNVKVRAMVRIGAGITVKIGVKFRVRFASKACLTYVHSQFKQSRYFLEQRNNLSPS